MHFSKTVPTKKERLAINYVSQYTGSEARDWEVVSNVDDTDYWLYHPQYKMEANIVMDNGLVTNISFNRTI